MASKLCCTAEQGDRPDSPELPNARVAHETPAERPLLPAESGSPNSRFTSAPSEDLYELQQVFDGVQYQLNHPRAPQRTPRARFSRPSMHSLRSLHKMTSMRSIIRRKFSKDLPVKGPSIPQVRTSAKNTDICEEPDTVVKRTRDGPNQQLGVSKHDLRKHLLSGANPNEGGYDSDAEMLDDIEKNIGKKTPGKRPSIHSIDWTPSTGGKPTPGSSTKGRTSAELKCHLHPYHIQKPPAVSISTRFSQVFSTPNLRLGTSDEKNRRLRRSYSATSMGLPMPSPISPLRLPSLTTHDQDGKPWSEVMHESLRLSHFPVPPRHISPKAPKISSSNAHKPSDIKIITDARRGKITNALPLAAENLVDAQARTVEIRLQQPTSITSPRTSTSIRGEFHENNTPEEELNIESALNEELEENPRRSVHLYSMRISHHLRSGSLLSWDQLAGAPELPTLPQSFSERAVSDQSRNSHLRRQTTRHVRQSSSSGFTSSKVPSRWGKVLPNDHEQRNDVASSIYSSRPQSPPNSFGGSTANLSRTDTGNYAFSTPLPGKGKLRRSSSFPIDNEDTPRPTQCRSVTSVTAAHQPTTGGSLPAMQTSSAREISVAEAKQSKFREEFSSSPLKKKLTPSASILQFLNPKRLSTRSHSDASLQLDSPGLAMDGLFDTSPIQVDRERRQSRSMMSMHAEQEALVNAQGVDHVWNRALKAHHDEKASLFIHKNRDLVAQASPFRERSGSTAARQRSVEISVESAAQVASLHKTSDVALVGSPSQQELEPESRPHLLSRRSALVGQTDVNPGQEVSNAFEKQGDGTEIVGAWGCYPSHTRQDRTISASKLDCVETRDFALEAAIRFATAKDDSHDHDLVDPTERLPSPPLLPGERKRKKKVGSGRMAKSNSMTFGKNFLKNYSKLFKSQSTEFRRHGRGHRSSIASGGILEFPELELLPDIWTGSITETKSTEHYERGGEHISALSTEKVYDARAKGKLRVDDSLAKLRQCRNSSAPDLNAMSFGDGVNDSKHAQDRARVWSIYYEHCVPFFPRPSTEMGYELEDRGELSRLSFDDKRAYLHARTMPARLSGHSRNASQLSRNSIVSRGSARPSIVSMVEDCGTGEKKSLVSVRRSTMDLLSKFKEQEITEHERMMSLTRADSRSMQDGLVTL